MNCLPIQIELGCFSREDVDLVAVSGRRDDAKLDLKKKFVRVLLKGFQCELT